MATTEQDVATRKRSNAMTKQTMQRYNPQHNTQNSTPPPNTPNSMTAAVMNYVPPPTNNGKPPDIPKHSKALIESSETNATNTQPGTKTQTKPPRSASQSTSWGKREHVNVTPQDPKKERLVDKQRARYEAGLAKALQDGIALAKINPEEYKTALPSTADLMLLKGDSNKQSKDKPSQDDIAACSNMIQAMDEVYKVANGTFPDNVKGMILLEYCENAAQAVTALDAMPFFWKHYANGMRRLQAYSAAMYDAVTYLSKWQGVENYQNMGVGSAKGGMNTLGIYKKQTPVGIGQGDTYFFRQETGKISTIQGTAGIDEKTLNAAKREKAFYILSEYLGTGLVTRTRESNRTVKDTKTGEVTKSHGIAMDAAKGKDAFSYNYNYLHMSGSYQTGEGEEQETHDADELIAYRKTAASAPPGEDSQTFGQRIEGKDISFSPKMSEIDDEDTRKGNGATVDALNGRFLKDYSSLNVLDALAGHPDRHGHNFLIDTDKKGNYKSMTAIDNDAVFGTKNAFSQDIRSHEDNQTGLHAGMHMDAALAKRILNTTEEILQDLFRYLLSVDEIKALWKRFQQVQLLITQNQLLLLTQDDWDTMDMKKLVLDEMKASAGSNVYNARALNKGGTPEDPNVYNATALNKEGTPEDPKVNVNPVGNSYISRLMFSLNALDADKNRTHAQKKHGWLATGAQDWKNY